MYIQRIFYITVFSILSLVCCLAQADSVYIADIQIIGNEKTRAYVIERQLGASGGDLVHPDQLVHMENRLLNTGLFSYAKASIVPDVKGSNSLRIEVQEGWYFLPSPSIDFADHDFGSWIDEGDMSLDRLNIGLKLYHLNFTGRGDFLKAHAEIGFQRKYALYYRLPYINRERTLGFELDLSYSENKEVAYTTIGDELQYLSTDNPNLLSHAEAGFRINYTPGLYNTHSFDLHFTRLGVADSIAELNPRFFDQNSTGLKYFSVGYAYTTDKRNRIPVSESGYKLKISGKKIGLGVFNELNLGLFEVEYEKYFPLSDHLTAYINPKARLYFIRNAPPYYLNSALGNGGRHIRGYNDYAINGMDYIHTSAGMRLMCFQTDINFGQLMPVSKLRHMPLKIYVAANLDAGRVWDPNFGGLNSLDNKILIGYGPAVHLLMYETFHFSVEYNFNHRYESGVYLRTEFNL